MQVTTGHHCEYELFAFILAPTIQQASSLGGPLDRMAKRLSRVKVSFDHYSGVFFI